MPWILITASKQSLEFGRPPNRIGCSFLSTGPYKALFRCLSALSSKLSQNFWIIKCRVLTTHSHYYYYYFCYYFCCYCC